MAQVRGSSAQKGRVLGLFNGVIEGYRGWFPCSVPCFHWLSAVGAFWGSLILR